VICVSFFIYSMTDNTISSSVTPFALVLASFACERLQQRRTIQSSSHMMMAQWHSRPLRSVPPLLRRRTELSSTDR
jgi:hypothetical protein